LTDFLLPGIYKGALKTRELTTWQGQKRSGGKREIGKRGTTMHAQRYFSHVHSGATFSTPAFSAPPHTCRRVKHALVSYITDTKQK